MQIETVATPVAESYVDTCTIADDASDLDIEASYDGSNVVYRLMRLDTWGPGLMNLGYYQFYGPLVFLNALANLELAQRRLVVKSVNLLKVERRHRVLDVACGRGKSSFMVHCMHPDATIVGMDLLEPHVQVAQTLFNQIGNLTYQVGDATELEFADSSFDRVMCLEAAFHFPDRAEFLREAYRVLRPGGRLIVVDFAWNTDADRSHRDDPKTRMVRDVWQWDDMFSISDYQRVAKESGFRTVSSDDWTRRVTQPVQWVFQFLSRLGNNRWGRRFLQWKNPLFGALSAKDWNDLALAVQAHKHVRGLSKYMAFVFEKP